MTFGDWREDEHTGRENKDGDSENGVEKKPEWYRVASNNRFWIDNRKGKNRADIIFVDTPEAYTNDQLHVLAGLGLGQGHFSIWEHNVKINGRWGNFFASGRNVSMSPLLRLLYLKIVGAWGKVGAHISEFINDLPEIDKFYMEDNIDTSLYKDIIDAEYWPRVSEIIQVPCGDTLKHRVNKSGDTVHSDDPISILFGSRATKRTFRTIIDRTKYTARDGREFVDQLKLFATTGKQTAKWGSEFETAGGGRRDKGVIGLGGHLYELTRNTGDKIPSVGDEKSYVEHCSIDYLHSINSDAVFILNKENVEERLSEDHYFTFHRMRATGFNDLTLEQTLDHVLNVFDANDKDVIVPRPADYPLILLPKTPSYIGSKYGGGDSIDPNEDDIPF